MPPEILAGSILGGASIGGNILSTLLTNRANRKLAEYSYEQQRQMINEQNQYNSPASAMQRYVDAGLNPNMIYGNIESGQQSGIAKYEAPTMQAPQVGNVPAMLGDAIRTAMQSEMLKADLDIKHQQFENLKEQQFAIRAERHARDIDNMYNSWLTGFDPGLVKQAGDMEGVASALRAHRATADLQSVEAMTAFRNASKAYVNIQEKVAKMDYNQKEYYYKNIQPLMKDIMEKRKEGLDVSNQLLTLQKQFFTADKIAGYLNMIAKDVALFINPLSGLGGGAPTPKQGSQLGSYTMDSYDLPGF